MPLSTYDELQTSILTWLARAPDDEDAVTSVVTDFITLGEVRFNRELRVREMIERIAAPIDEIRESMPARFLAAISASIILPSGASYPLKYVSAHELNRGARNVEGDPLLYTITGGEILFGPKVTFDDDVAVEDRPQIEIVGYFSQPVLSENNPENDILKHYPNIYLYASLIEAEAFIASDQLTTWVAAYDNAIASANQSQGDSTESMAREGPPAYLVV